MPIFEFECQICGEIQEILYLHGEEDPHPVCSCGSIDFKKIPSLVNTPWNRRDLDGGDLADAMTSERFKKKEKISVDDVKIPKKKGAKNEKS